MEWWVIISVGAALAQAVRFGLQKQLRATGLSSVGATFARFFYSAPLMMILALFYARISGQSWPQMPRDFWAYALTGGVAQILATVCLVSLFAQRNFAVGVALIKTEVILSVVVGVLLLDEAVSLAGMLAIVMGVVAVLLLSDSPQVEGRWFQRILNAGAGLGLAAGALFAVSAVSYRGATLALPFGDALLRGGVTLACVTAFQLCIMAAFMAWRARDEIGRVVRAWRVAGVVGITSLIGSLGWFTAFAMQQAAYVKAVGQIELAFVVLGGWLFFGEKLSRRETAGLLVLAVSMLILILL